MCLLIWLQKAPRLNGAVLQPPVRKRRCKCSQQIFVLTPGKKPPYFVDLAYVQSHHMKKKKKKSKRNVSTSSLCQIATSSSDLKLRKDVSHCSLPKENQNKTKPIKCCNLYKIQLQFFFLKKLCVLSEYYLIMELRRKVETEAITTSRALLLD